VTDDTIAGTAIILTSEFDPGAVGRRDGEGDGARDQGPIGMLLDTVGGLPYAFLLEVTPAGSTPYQVAVRSRVPPKAEKIGMLQAIRIPPSLQVPVLIDPSDPTKVAIDWTAFLGLPDRQRLVREALVRAQAATIRKQQAAAPDKFAALQAQNQSVAMNWAETVRAGQMTRAEFETSAARLVQLGAMAQADYEAGVARIEEP
jgi:predicted DNA-binding WGR domain protein